MLRKIGGECTGALVISETPPETGKHDYIDLKPEDLHMRLSQDNVYASMTGENHVRLSLAGAQDKLAVLLTNDNQIKVPQMAAPSTHILKFANKKFKCLVPNEYYITKLASHLGLNVSESDLVLLGKTDYLLVFVISALVVVETVL